MLGTEHATVLLGDLRDEPRPILLALTRARPDREALAVDRILLEVKTRLIEGYGPPDPKQ